MRFDPILRAGGTWIMPSCSMKVRTVPRPHVRQSMPHIRQSRPHTRQSRPHIRQSRPHIRQSRPADLHHSLLLYESEDCTEALLGDVAHTRQSKLDSGLGLSHFQRESVQNLSSCALFARQRTCIILSCSMKVRTVPRLSLEMSNAVERSWHI